MRRAAWASVYRPTCDPAMATVTVSRLNPPPAAIAALRHGERELAIEWADGRHSRFAAIWLLDNRPDGRHGPDGQRLFDIAELAEEPQIAAAAIADDGVSISFSGGLTAAFAADWLRAHALDEDS